MITDNKGKQLSPCICSKARYALRIKTEKPKNKKRCSRSYWERTVKAIAKKHDYITEDQVIKAIDKFPEIIRPSK